MENAKLVLMVITQTALPVRNAMKGVQLALVEQIISAQDVTRDTFWMFQLTAVGLSFQILIHYVESIAIRILLVNIMSWLVTTVHMLDPIEHLNLEIIGLIQMNQNACIVINIVPNVQDI